MKYNFDAIVNRKANKERRSDLDYLKENYLVKDFSQLINSSIADLDFPTPEPIREAIIQRANLSTYSYTFVQKEFNQAIVSWYQKLHQITIKAEDIKLGHGTVNALFQIVQAFTKPNDAVLIQTPIYGPFIRAINLAQRKLVENPLIENGKNYEIDLKDFETKIIKHQIKLFLFCNPHNPAGVVWPKDVVEKIISICQKHNVLIVSDEVHGDLVLNKQTHNSMLNYQNIYENFIVCNSPNKAFNLGGLKGSYLIIHNKKIREKINEQYEINSTTSPNIFFQPALIAAYTSDQVFGWLSDLKDYVYQNFQILKTSLQEFKKITILELQASYLVWIKFDKKAISNLEFKKLLLDNNLIVGMGDEFGSHEESWFRINIGMSKEKLLELIERLKIIFN